ncbi:MAG: Argininosuccinate synthase, partial [uncultured Acidimicrobiales bacterium]
GQARRPRLQRGSRHLRRRQVAAAGDGGGGHLRRRRRRPRRRLGGDQGPGPRHRRRGGRGRRLHGGVRIRLRRAGAQGQRPLRGEVPARLGPVAPRDREAPGGRRPAVRRRRRRPRLHRQGERPGALRGRDQGAGAGPRDPGPRAPLGPHPRGRDRVRSPARHPDLGHEGEALLDRRQPLGPGHRVRPDGGPVGHAAGGRVVDDEGHRRRAPGRRHRLRAGGAGDGGRRTAHAGEGHRPDERGGRRLRLRPARHGGEPQGRHQEQGDLRGTRRPRPPPRPQRPRGPHARARPPPREGAARAPLVGARLRRHVVLAPQGGARRVHRREPALRDRRGAAPPRARAVLRHRASQRLEPVRLRPRHLRRRRHLRPRAGRRLREAVGPRHRDLVEPTGRPGRARPADV